MIWVVIVVYTLSMLLITLFSLGQLSLTMHYLGRKKSSKNIQALTSYPLVTIQLPVYNEKYVVERLINAVAGFDYPKERMDIQVLDDSDDETSDLIENAVKAWTERGIQITHLQRIDRTGYKAGALQDGLERAKGEFIAIFDADFIPYTDFLLKTLPHFVDDKTGMVQTRWTHLNEDYSLLTRMQAFGLNAHFTIEQMGRKSSGSFINFNGTGGVWRKTCIQDAGGWEFDTLTEDLDLSYRAQLRGWNFEYLETVDCPAELPVILPALKSQQYRWNKGAAETARKNLFELWKSKMPFSLRMRGTMHLLNSSVFLFLLVASLLSVPMLYIKSENPKLSWVFDLGSLFILGFVAIGIFYWFASKSIKTVKTTSYFLLHFPLFLIFSMGLALHNSIAILEGFLGKKTPFVRTPKFNVRQKMDNWRLNTYLNFRFSPVVILEGILAFYFLFGLVYGVSIGDFGLMPFHMMLMLGFGTMFYFSLSSKLYAT